MIAAITGLIAGLLHVVTGPDHMAAIAPLAVRGQRRAWVSGVRWGLGHASGVVAVGVLSILLRNVLPIDSISSWSERFVGVILIGIGCWGLRNALRMHVHEHQHHDEPHAHLHAHAPARPHPAPTVHVHTHTAFGIGTLHGLAGSSHFLGVLPALAFATNADAAAYLISFGVGTIAAMAIFASGIGLISSRLAVNGVRAYRNMMCACSVAAMGIGVWWLLQLRA